MAVRGLTVGGSLCGQKGRSYSDISIQMPTMDNLVAQTPPWISVSVTPWAPTSLLLVLPGSWFWIGHRPRASWPLDPDGGPQQPLFTDLIDNDVHTGLLLRITELCMVTRYSIMQPAKPQCFSVFRSYFPAGIMMWTEYVGHSTSSGSVFGLK